MASIPRQSALTASCTSSTGLPYTHQNDCWITASLPSSAVWSINPSCVWAALFRVWVCVQQRHQRYVMVDLDHEEDEEATRGLVGAHTSGGGHGTCVVVLAPQSCGVQSGVAPVKFRALLLQ